MGKVFHCEVEYLPSPHLMQIYAGFFKLQDEGVIDLVLKPRKYEYRTIPVINATINKKYKVIYDTQDGLSWINDSEENNLQYFQQNYPVNFYFKRSFHSKMLDFKPAGCQVYPLGFNYNVHPDRNLIHLTEKLQDKFKYYIKTNSKLKSIFNKRFYYAKDFEYYPIKAIRDKVLFLTRVWNPLGEDVFSEEEKLLREKINKTRIMCLEACGQEFGDRFTGGLWQDDFSDAHFRHYVLPISQTNKSTFLKRVREHTICIATTGLYKSIGWKMGEYVAASRAIVSEKLQFEVPGNFKKDQNYFEFENQDQLLEKIDTLLRNKELLIQTMKNNYQYYNNYLKPDILVLNTLLTIANNE